MSHHMRYSPICFVTVISIFAVFSYITHSLSDSIIAIQNLESPWQQSELTVIAVQCNLYTNIRSLRCT